ncbi:unnamed protein product [Notodromas monacha]|uniref:Ig-like domain-containing protein n=1 Tax=Notodromas monacha TaxID=399045 RepID=A0A7R9BPY8_9CRUS|nr:unnamed protein product [Notodromas monacha]CAG0919293.1 unnamed protein product [Notodromas monacha]
MLRHIMTGSKHQLHPHLGVSDCVRLPAISFVNQEEEATLGDSLELQCVVHFGSDFSVIWLKKNPTEPPTSVTLSVGGNVVIPDPRFHVLIEGGSDEQVYTLEVMIPSILFSIRDITETDEGLYVCQVVVSTQESVYAEVNVLVLRPPTISDESTRSLIVSDGDDFRLDCIATGYPEPTVTWRRAKNEPFSGLDGAVVTYGEELLIPNATKLDRGTYYCMAWNGVGKGVRRRMSVSVQFKPDVWTTRWRVGQALQYDQVMECHVDAFPSPAIAWIANYAITDEITSTTLTVLSAEKRQFGNYTCKAGNKFGFAEADVMFSGEQDE